MAGLIRGRCQPERPDAAGRQRSRTPSARRLGCRAWQAAGHPPAPGLTRCRGRCRSGRRSCAGALERVGHGALERRFMALGGFVPRDRLKADLGARGRARHGDSHDSRSPQRRCASDLSPVSDGLGLLDGPHGHIADQFGDDSHPPEPLAAPAEQSAGLESLVAEPRPLAGARRVRGAGPQAG